MAAKLEAVSPETIWLEVEKILASKTFSPSGQLRSFLRFTVEKTLQGCGDQIKEYLIGVEVFGRGESFDPRTDSIVRGQANRLRSRLETYYTSEGLHDDVVIEYPKGTYAPVFRRREGVAPAQRASVQRKTLWLSAAGVALVCLATYLVLPWQRPRLVPATAVPSIAVLPFVDMSPEKDQGVLL